MPAKLERCVRKVKRRGGARDPWAICVASLGGRRRRRRRRRKRSRRTGRFIR